jgi:hypothetical protein
MKKTPFVFIPYSNLDHSEVSTRNWLKFSEEKGDLEKMVNLASANGLPFTLSTQGIDIECLNTRNPKLVRRIAEKNEFLRGLFSHVLPSFYPEHLDSQLAEEDRVKRELGIKQHSIGMLPEFDMFQGLIPSLRLAGWNYVLLHKGINKYDSEESHDLVNIKDELGVSIKAIATRGDLFRNSYLKMLRRDSVSPKDTVELIVQETEKASERKLPVLTFLIDAEAPVMNNAMGEYKEFMFYLGKAKREGRVNVSGFNEEVLDDLNSFFNSQLIPTVHVASRPKPKWVIGLDELKIADLIKNTDFNSLTDYHKKVYLCAGISDLYSAQFDFRKSPDGIVARLPKYLGGEEVGKIPIQGDRNRIYEVQHLIKALQTKKPLNEDLGIELSPESQEKMAILHQSFL